MHSSARLWRLRKAMATVCSGSGAGVRRAITGLPRPGHRSLTGTSLFAGKKCVVMRTAMVIGIGALVVLCALRRHDLGAAIGACRRSARASPCRPAALERPGRRSGGLGRRGALRCSSPAWPWAGARRAASPSWPTCAGVQPSRCSSAASWAAGSRACGSSSPWPTSTPRRPPRRPPSPLWASSACSRSAVGAARGPARRRAAARRRRAGRRARLERDVDRRGARVCRGAGGGRAGG